MHMITTKKHFNTAVCWEPRLSTMKRNKQIKRNAHVSMVDNVIYIRMILETFEASLSFKTKDKFDLVVDLIWLLVSIWCPLNLILLVPPSDMMD